MTNKNISIDTNINSNSSIDNLNIKSLDNLDTKPSKPTSQSPLIKLEPHKLLDLLPSEYNPRTATKEQEQALSSSLKKYGCVEPIIVNEYQQKDKDGNLIESENRYNIIIGGHFRVRELIKLNIEFVDCVIVNLNKEDEKELNVRLNSNTGEWDYNLLLSNFNTDELNSWGFNGQELESLIFKTEQDKLNSEDGIIDDENNLPLLPDDSNTKTKLGDIFLLGNHRLLCGDSTDTEQVKLLMNHNQADLVITDPPYNVAYDKSKKHDKILNDEMETSKFYDFLFKVFKNYNEVVLKDGGSIYVFHSDSERINFTRSFTENNLYLSQILIWVKNHFCMSRQDYQNKHEPIMYGWKKGSTHYFTEDRIQESIFNTHKINESKLNKSKKEDLIRIIRKLLLENNSTCLDKKSNDGIGKDNNINDNLNQSNLNQNNLSKCNSSQINNLNQNNNDTNINTNNTQSNLNTDSTIFYCERPNVNDLHPTMKPIKLLCRFIINSSKINDLIVDLFGGSGSTLIACEQMNRTCYTMELDPKYCDVIIERWQNITNKQAIRLSDNKLWSEIDLL